MLRPDALTVKPVGQADQVRRTEPAGDARQEAFERSLAGLLGKTVKGEVLSKLTDGSYLVRVNNNSARLLLPQGTQVGAEVPLTLVATTPRPTFQISTETPGAAPRFAYTEAGP